MGSGRGRVYGLCNGREERKRGREALEEREKIGRNEEGGPSNGNKLGPIKKLSPNLNRVGLKNRCWIKKQVEAKLKFGMGLT